MKSYYYQSLGLPFLLLLLCSLSEQTTQQSQIRIDPDGGYTGIVIKINKDVPQDLCPKILSNIKVSKKYFSWNKTSKKNNRFCYEIGIPTPAQCYVFIIICPV